MEKRKKRISTHGDGKPLLVDYKKTIVHIAAIIERFCQKTMRLLNQFRNELYWEIGHIIVEKQEKSGWGEDVVEYLALDLQSRFSTMKGLSSRSLWRMRRFYLAYRNDRELSSLAKKICWSHNIIIVSRNI